jgi:hypothetical protein
LLSQPVKIEKPKAFEKEKYLRKFRAEYGEFCQAKEEYAESKQNYLEKKNAIVEWQDFFAKNDIDLEEELGFE